MVIRSEKAYKAALAKLHGIETAKIRGKVLVKPLTKAEIQLMEDVEQYELKHGLDTPSVWNSKKLAREKNTEE